MIQSDSIAELMPALVKARGEFAAAIKDAQNPHLRNKYASLSSVIDAVAPALADNGLIVVQPTMVDDAGEMRVQTRVYHASGQYIGCEYPVHVPEGAKNRHQAEGSALTYARRYSLLSLVCIAPEDDDGEASAPSRRRPEALDAAGKAFLARGRALADDDDKFSVEAFSALRSEIEAHYGGGASVPKIVINPLIAMFQGAKARLEKKKAAEAAEAAKAAEAERAKKEAAKKAPAPAPKQAAKPEAAKPEAAKPEPAKPAAPKPAPVEPAPTEQIAAKSAQAAIASDDAEQAFIETARALKGDKEKFTELRMTIERHYGGPALVPDGLFSEIVGIYHANQK